MSVKENAREIKQGTLWFCRSWNIPVTVSAAFQSFILLYRYFWRFFFPFLMIMVCSLGIKSGIWNIKKKQLRRASGKIERSNIQISDMSSNHSHRQAVDWTLVRIAHWLPPSHRGSLMEVSVVCRVLHKNMQGKLSWREKSEDVEEEEEASREDGSPEMMVLRENSRTQESATRVSRVSQREAMTFWSRDITRVWLNAELSHMTFGNQAPRVWRRSSGRTDRQTDHPSSFKCSVRFPQSLLSPGSMFESESERPSSSKQTLQHLMHLPVSLLLSADRQFVSPAGLGACSQCLVVNGPC